MITGFNTDIKYDGVTYHVQTEDKGVKTPLILSLVYEGGTILASKRSPYDDLLVEKFDEKILEERLNRQHNLICAAIRAGRVGDLQKMTKKAAFDKQKDLVVIDKVGKVIVPTEITKKADIIIKTQQEEVQFVPKPKEEVISKPKIDVETSKPIEGNNKEAPAISLIEPKEKSQPTELETEIPIPKPIFVEQTKEKTPQPIFKENAEKESPKPIIEEIVENTPQPISGEKVEPKSSQTGFDENIEHEIPKPVEEAVWDIPIIEDVTIVEDVDFLHSQVEEEFILPPDAVEIIGDLEQFESLLEDELKVKILGENKFESGDRKNINILVFRGNEETAVENSSVMVKVIGSAFRPLIYHAKADINGVATVFLKLPTFRSGRAALLIRAMVDGEETELRRAIKPK